MAKEVKYKLGLDASEFSKGIKEASSALGDFGKSITQGMGIGIGIAAAQELGNAIKAAVAAIPGAVADLAQFGDGLKAMEARTGIGVEALQKFSFAGKLANVELSSITGAFSKFQNALASGNDKAASALGRIGLSFQELRGLSPERQLEAIATGFDKITDPAMRTRTAIEIFGKSGAEMLQLFDGGMKKSMETAEQLGMVLSKNVVGSAADLQDGFDTVGGAFEGLKNNFISVIVESEPLHVAIQGLAKMAGDLSIWVNKNKDSLRAWVDQGIAIAAQSLSVLVEAVEIGMAVIKAMTDIWAYAVAGVKTFIAAQEMLANTIKIGPKAAFEEYQKTVSANMAELKASLKSNDDALASAIGLTSKIKGITDEYGRSVINASGKTHQAAEVNRTYGDSFEDVGEKAKTTAAQLKEMKAILAAAGVGKGGLATGALQMWMPGVRTEESGADIAKQIIAGAGIGQGGLDAGTMKLLGDGPVGIGQMADSSAKLGKNLGTAKEHAFDFSNALQIATNTMNVLGISSDSFFSSFVGGALSAGAAMQNAMKGIQGKKLGDLSLGQGAQLAAGVLQVGAGIYAGASSNTGKAALGGAAQGAMAGAQVGGLAGAAIGGIGGAILGIFGSSAKRKKELAEIRSELLDEFGGSMDAVRKKAQELGVDIEKAFSTKSPKEARAAVEELHGAMEHQQQVMAGLGSAMEAQSGRAKLLFDAVKSGSMSAEDAGAAFDRLGLRMSAAFATQVQQTGDVVGALMQIGPGLEAMIAAQDQLGISASATSTQLIGMYTALRDSGMGEQLTLLNQEMQGMSDAGIHSQAIFTSFGTDAAAIFAELTGKTGDQGQALAMMQPTLQHLFEMQRDYGFAVDETTGEMLKQAEAQGLVGDQMRSVNDKILQVLIAIAEAAGARIPEGFARAKDAAEDYGRSVNNLPSPGVPGLGGGYNENGGFTSGLEHGFMGFVPATAGGVPSILSERGRGEYVVPEDQADSFARGRLGDAASTAELRGLRMDLAMMPEQMARAIMGAMLTTV